MEVKVIKGGVKELKAKDTGKTNNKDKQKSDDSIKELLFKNFIKFSAREKQNQKLKPKCGEIYTCDLGLNIGSELDNVRPCIIITGDKYNEKSSVVTVIPISKRTKLFFHQVEINEYTVEEIETMIEGTAKLEQITTISKGKLGRRIGKMSKAGMNLIYRAMQYHFSMEKEAK